MALQEEIVDRFKAEFGNLGYVTKIDTYKQVVYIEVRTENLSFGIEFDELRTVELVCRNDKTIDLFSRHFLASFQKGNLLIKENVVLNRQIVACSNVHGQRLEDVASLILASCIKVDQDVSRLLHDTLRVLRSLNDQAQINSRNDFLLDYSSHMSDRLLTISETVQTIKDEELSVARFGDGEIKCMVTESGTSFQKHDWFLMQELREMSSKNPENLLVCYPSPMVENRWWQGFWPQYWAKCKFYLQNERFGDSFITRPQAFHIYGEPFASTWKSIWDSKRVCFITGGVSRMNIEHVLFDNIAEATTIYSKSTDAYADLDNVIAQCKAQKNIDMFLVALGPAGTALAYRLSTMGFRALDIGHLNNSYDNALLNAPRPELLKFE